MVLTCSFHFFLVADYSSGFHSFSLCRAYMEILTGRLATGGEIIFKNTGLLSADIY